MKAKAILVTVGIALTVLLLVLRFIALPTEERVALDTESARFSLSCDDATCAWEALVDVRR